MMAKRLEKRAQVVEVDSNSDLDSCEFKYIPRGIQ